MTYDRRLIEDSLPLEVISEQSAREKSIRHGHISTLHIWWARRPLAAMRAAIFASLIPAPKDDAERDYLHALIKDIVNWDAVKDGNNARVEEARALIRQHYPDAPPKVLDPFMGGGSTGLEALRLGAEAHGVELNPVAYLIQLCTLVYPQKYGQPKTVHAAPEVELEQTEIPGMEDPRPRQMGMDLSSAEPAVVQNPLAADVRKWGMWVLEEARKEIGHLYEDPEGRAIIGYVWARTAKCPNPQCGAEMPMVRQWWLAKTPYRNAAIRVVVDKETKTISFEVDEEVAKDAEWPNEGTMKRGTIVCSICGQAPSDDYLREQGRANQYSVALMTVMYDRPEQAGKGYRSATAWDVDCFSRAETLLGDKMSDDPSVLPDEPLPPYGTLGFRVNNYGLTKWGDLFNSRQALSLITFLEKTREAYKLILREHGEDYAKVIATYLALLVDRLADFNSTLCVLNNVGGRGVVHTFGRQALPMVWDYAETNPFNETGANWLAAIDAVYDTLTSSLKGLNEPASLRQGSSTRLTYHDRALDAVITDPPY